MALSRTLLVIIVVALLAATQCSPVDALKRTSKYSKSKRQMSAARQKIYQRPGFNATRAFVDQWLQSLIPLTDITLLLPANVATLQSLPSDQRDQILSYHVLTTRFLYKDITAVKSGDAMDTLEGSTVTKYGPAGSRVVLFKGKNALPAVLVGPDAYVGEAFTVQMISQVLTPVDM